MDMEGLSTICADLGIIGEDEEGKQIGYEKGEYCLDSLKDLLRFLRRDDPQTREVFKQVCKWNIVSKNLIPIIEHCQDDRNLVLNAVKVLVFLSMPIEPSSSDIPQQTEYLWNLKSSITSSDTVAFVVSLLEVPLENLEHETFTEDDWKLVQLVLTLFRNVLAVQDISLLQKGGRSTCQFVSVRDRFLELFFCENVTDLIIVMTQHVGGPRGYFRQDNLLLLEIFHYIFMGQDPELIAKAHSRTSEGGGAKASIDGLKSIMEEEQAKRKLSRINSNVRHSQFSGTFARVTMDGSKTVFKGNPASASQNALLKPHKGQKGPNKMISTEHGKILLSKNNILEMLHDFLNQFLSGGYNVLMQSVHEDIEKEHHAVQNCDIIVYFKVAEFVTAFQYHKFSASKPTVEADSSEDVAYKCADNSDFKGNICGPIAASMNESMFQVLISRWRNTFDGLKETNDYKFLSAAGSLMKNMIHMLDLVLRLLPEDSKEPQTARILLYKLFYDQTDQGLTHFILNLVRTFNTHKQSKSDLADLVEMMHLIVQLMEKLQARGSLRVSRKSRKMKKKKAVAEKEAEHEPCENHDAMPSELLTELNVLENKSPKDDQSERREDISNPILVDDYDMHDSKVEDLPQTESTKPDHSGNDHYSVEDSSGDEPEVSVNEVDFKVSTIISAFANCNIIQKLCWLLKFYRSNSIRTNDYIVCVLRRITDDLELSPMLYQLSLLKTFHEILADQKSCPNKDYENIVNFIKNLVRSMLKKMKKQPLLFIEVLFWKSRKECHYISAEYLLYELSSWRNVSSNQGNVSKPGEIGSLEGTGPIRRSIADALGEDEADVFIPHELEPRNDANPMEDVSVRLPEGNKRKVILNDELTPKIRDLYEKFKHDPNCSRLIAESLDPDGKIVAAQVSNKLKQLGLKIAAKRRNASERCSHPDQKGDEDALHNLNDIEGSSLGKPLNSRKGVRAFTKNQEEMIKNLFEQFKGQKKCSSRIADALDADRKLTAAQVSRKLKQLGLMVPRKKLAIDIELRGKELNADETHDSDSETLFSFRNRSKKRDNKSLLRVELAGQSTEDKLSDDETLSTVLKKKRKIPRSTEERPVTTLTEGLIDGNFGRSSEKLEGRERNERPKQDVVWEADGTSEAEMRDAIAENHSGDSPVNVLDDLPSQIEDELADSGDDVASTPLLSSINRRKLRMVLDIEDDD